MKVRLIFSHFILIALMSLPSLAFSSDPEERLIGTWWNTEKDAKIEVYRCGGKLCGKVIWLKDPIRNGAPVKDENNSESAKKNRQIMGLEILSDFKFDGKDRWTGGQAYDPKSGKSYTSYLRLKNPKELELRGYIGSPIFGRTVLWIKAD
jgi:uncharacterized protein (DUF2147 family)